MADKNIKTVADAEANVPAAPAKGLPEYLSKLGLDASALDAPPVIDEIAAEAFKPFRFIGSTNPDYEYFRATAKRPEELRRLVNHEKWRIAQDVTLDGVRGPEDVVLCRHKTTSAAIERRDRDERNSLRNRGRRGSAQMGNTDVAVTETTKRRALVEVPASEAKDW